MKLEKNMKKFMTDIGGTCSNWNWAWSYVNEDAKEVYMPVWDVFDKGTRGCVLKPIWNTETSRKKPGYKLMLEHIRLVVEEGYKLKVYTQVLDKARSEHPRAVRKGFYRDMTPARLIEQDGEWFAVRD